MSGIIELVRRGVLTTRPTTVDEAPRVIRVAEIYPYYLFHYPNQDALKGFLSCARLPDPSDKLLLQVLTALQAHVGPPLPFCNPPV